jgi:hypothetical protein
MRKPDPVEIENAEPSTLVTFAALALFIGFCFALLIIAATPMPA